jgi:hypothetical protein
MSSNLEVLQQLIKSLEAGGYNAAPGSLVQGSALQVEDLSPVMKNVTYGDQHIKLQKALKSENCKSTYPQWVRNLSVGSWDGMAVLEGGVGDEGTSDYARIGVPMAFFAKTRRVTMAADMVATVDGKKGSDREAEKAALELAGGIEFECFLGKANYSNAGVFDGNPQAIASNMPGMQGVEQQARQSDSERNAQDLMFAEYGSADSIVIAGGGTLTQDMIEDASVRVADNFGSPDKLFVSNRVLSAYNKISYGKERILLGGAPQDATGAELRRQWTSMGSVPLEASRFLAGKTQPRRTSAGAPGAPTIASSTTPAGSTGLAAGNYWYMVTAFNERGESGPASSQLTLALNDYATLDITAGSGVVRGYNVYRSNVGGSLASAKFIGRVVAASSGNTTFTDLANKRPGFSTGFMLQLDSWAMKELAPYSRVKLAQTDLSTVEAHFKYCCIAGYEPRKNALVDNLLGSF